MKVKNLLTDQLPPPYALADGVVLGGSSRFFRDKKTRLILRDRYVDVGQYAGTQQSVTRNWLRDNVKKRIAKRTELAGLEKTRAPMYAESAYLPDAVYMDISSAYQSVYSVLGWGVDYVRGKYLAGGRDALIYPYKNLKIGRSLVITGAKPRSRIVMVKNGAPKVYEMFNPFSNPSLVSATLDVLSSIARFAVSLFGAIYYNVDGAIIPRENAPMYREFITSLGMTCKTKGEGAAFVDNVTNWTLGKKTVRLGRSGKILGGDWIPVSNRESDWILSNFIEVLRQRGALY